MIIYIQNSPRVCKNVKIDKVIYSSYTGTLWNWHYLHFFAVVLHDYNVKLPEVSWLHVLWRKCRTCSCSLFFHRRSFSPSWPLAFLIFSPPLQNFMLFLPQKMSPLFFLSRFISFLVDLRWPVALLSLFLCLSLSLFSNFVDNFLAFIGYWFILAMGLRARELRYTVYLHKLMFQSRCYNCDER